MTFKHRYLFPLIFVLEITLLITCVGTVYKKTAATDNTQSIHYNNKLDVLLNSEYSGSGNIAFYEIINDYSNEHQISISCDALYGADFYLKLNTDFSTGNEPDVILTTPGYNMESLYLTNKLALLQKDINNDEKWYDSLDTSALSMTSRDKNIYGIPMETQFLALYSNTQILNKYGIKVPKSFPEFINAVNILKSNGITPLAFGIYDSDMLLYQAITAAVGGYYELGTAAETATLTAAYVKAFELMQNLYNSGAFPNNFEHIGRMDSQQLFLKEEAAFIVESSSFANTIAKHSNDNYFSTNKFDISMFPVSDTPILSIRTWDDKNKNQNFFPVAYGATSFTVFVSKKAYDTKHDEVIDFIKHLTSSESMQKLSDERGAIPAIGDSNPTAGKKPTANIVVERNLILGNSMEITAFPDTVIDKYIWYSRISNRVADIVTGRMEASDVINEANMLIKSTQGGLK